MSISAQDYTDVVFDIECATLDTSKPKAIMQVGFAAFSRIVHQLPMISKSYYFTSDINDYCPETVEWWKENNLDQWNHLRSKAGEYDYAANSRELARMSNDLIEFGVVKVWGNGAIFDIAYLNNLFALHTEVPKPWTYRDERCFRTVQAEYTRPVMTHDFYKELTDFYGTQYREDEDFWLPHDGEYDAVMEAYKLKDMLANGL